MPSIGAAGLWSPHTLASSRSRAGGSGMEFGDVADVGGEAKKLAGSVFSRRFSTNESRTSTSVMSMLSGGSSQHASFSGIRCTAKRFACWRIMAEPPEENERGISDYVLIS